MTNSGVTWIRRPAEFDGLMVGVPVRLMGFVISWNPDDQRVHVAPEPEPGDTAAASIKTFAGNTKGLANAKQWIKNGCSWWPTRHLKTTCPQCGLEFKP